MSTIAPPAARWPFAVAIFSLLSLQLALTLLSRPSSVAPWGPLDLLIAIVIGGALVRYRLPLRRAYPWLAGASLTVVLIYASALTVFPMFFGRSFTGRYDILMAGNLVDLLFDSGSRWSSLLICLGAAAALACIIALIAWLLGAMARGLSALSPYRWVALAAITFGLFGTATGLMNDRRSLLAGELVDELDKARVLLSEHEGVDRAMEERRLELSAMAGNLELVRGQSVFLFVVESYGEAIWKEPSYRSLFEPFRLDIESSLRESGFQMASRLIRSPVRGGGSWFAHTTMLTGFACDNPIVYRRVLHSGLEPMAAYFRRAGHHTVSVLPALDIPKDGWPEGEFFRFDERFWYHDFGYSGRKYGWSPIPDQFAVQSFGEQVVAPDPERPLFVDFTLTSSHSPFRWVPPYIEGNPSTAELTKAYRNRQPTEYANSYHRLLQPAEGYTESIRYSLQSVIDFALTSPMSDAVFIVVGDHQPMTLLKGTESHLVPLHVFSRDPEIVQRFVDENFGPGLLPKRSRMKMQELLPLLLRMFSE